LASALQDRYRLERELGQGGMATVYLAQDLKHDRKVAIKVLRPELAAIIGAERFLSEIKTTANLQHPNILPLHDSGEADSFLYYVMPFVEGESLRDRLQREKQLPIGDAVRIATEVAGALDYAHRHGIIHRDIKPENIMLHDGRALVADFGIALAASRAGARMTETGMSLGTPHYMSPEQAMGDRELTPRSDVYALGAVTYEMLLGEPPFTGPTAQSIMAKVMTETPTALLPRRARIPPQVEDAILTALEKLPADRFPTAAAFAEALIGPARPRAVAGLSGGRPWLADRRTWLVLAIAAISLTAALILLVRSRKGSVDLAAVSVVQRTFRWETIFAARWAPDGKTIFYSAAGNPRIYVIRPDYPEPQPFGPDSAHLLAISSTGELALLTHPRFRGHLVFVGTLARMPQGGGAPREIMENVREADWSPDGSQLAITHRVGEGDQLEYPVGRVRYRDGRGGYLSNPRVSPGGDRVAFFDHPRRWDDRGSVVVVDTTGKTTTVAADLSGLEGLAWDPDGRSVLFSGSTQNGNYQVQRAGIGSSARLVLPSPGNLILHDVAKVGGWLVTRDDQSYRILVHPPGSAGVKDMSWLDYSIGPIISADGRLLAFTDQSSLADSLYSVMVRKTDGSPVVRLGEGVAHEISPDNRWVIGELSTAPLQFMLYPTGAGESRRLTWAGLETVNSVDFFPDGGSFFVCGNERARAARCYQSPLDGSSLEPVTPDSIDAGLLRPDGLAVLARRRDGLWVYPLSGGIPQKVAGADGDEVARWSPDGTALWVRAAGATRIDRLDVATGRRTVLLTIDGPKDVPGFQFLGISLADDPRVYAYAAWSYSSLLFTVQGVR
jgi:sugar lactone lactonase YvrE/tRNA A-37 threonylcarbamoyl transferase component Bud32